MQLPFAWSHQPALRLHKSRGGGTQCSLFAHCRPVCTTEIGRLALKYKDLASKVSRASVTRNQGSGVIACASALLVPCYPAFGRSTHLVLVVHPTPAASPLLLTSAPACPAFHATWDNLTVDPAALFVVHRRASSWRRCRVTRSSRTRSGWRMSCPTGEDAAEPRLLQPAQPLVTHCTGVWYGPLRTGHAACMRCSASQRACTAALLTPMFLCTCSENNITVSTLALFPSLWLPLSCCPAVMSPSASHVCSCVLPACLHMQHSPAMLPHEQAAHVLVSVLQIDFPIIADPTREVSVKYGMLDPNIKVQTPNQPLRTFACCCHICAICNRAQAWQPPAAARPSQPQLELSQAQQQVPFHLRPFGLLLSFSVHHAICSCIHRTRRACR
jgi:hypothetical protein